jgi:hypothetical protein
MKLNTYFTAVFCCTIFCCLINGAATAQGTDADLRIGQWQSYQPFTAVVAVAQSVETVFYATPQAIIEVDKSDGSQSFVTRINGLSDINIEQIGYNIATKTLIIAYKNGNLDLVRPDGSVVNMSDIVRATVTGARTVNHIYSVGNMAYLSCAFGLVQLDVASEQIMTTTFVQGAAVQGCALQRDTLWMATEKGLYFTPKSQNMEDFGQWSAAGALTTGLPATHKGGRMTIFKNTLVTTADGALYWRQGNTWQLLFAKAGTTKIVSLDAATDYIAVALKGGFPDGLALVYGANFDFQPYPPSANIADISGAVVDAADANLIWLANKGTGMQLYKGDKYASTRIAVNAPQSKDCRQTAISPIDGSLWLATGSIEDNWSYLYNSSGYFHLKEGIWTAYNRQTQTALANCLDVICTAIRPSDGHIFMGMNGSERRPFLIETAADGAIVKVYDANSGTSIQGDADYADGFRISGLAFDKDNNLWCANRGAPKPLSVMKPDGTWQSFTLPASLTGYLAIDQNDFKWIVIDDENGGVVVFDDGDLAKNGDERSILLNSSNTVIPKNYVHSLAVDLDGDVWIGSDEGATVFQCTGSVFNTTNGCKGSRPVVVVNGIGENLLQQADVQCIGVDGANRKWFGTSGGIFVQSADGRTSLATFNKANAPLPSNRIQNFTFDDKTGVVWISTVEGLMSYRTDATKGAVYQDKKAVIAFPNPVRPDYDGPIAIKGLVRNAIVKITDISGAMVYETTANGGEAIWNGRDYNGKRAASGVYLVYISSIDGVESAVAKIMVLR